MTPPVLLSLSVSSSCRRLSICLIRTVGMTSFRSTRLVSALRFKQAAWWVQGPRVNSPQSPTYSPWSSERHCGAWGSFQISVCLTWRAWMSRRRVDGSTSRSWMDCFLRCRRLNPRDKRIKKVSIRGKMFRFAGSQYNMFLCIDDNNNNNNAVHRKRSPAIFWHKFWCKTHT